MNDRIVERAVNLAVFLMLGACGSPPESESPPPEPVVNSPPPSAPKPPPSGGLTPNQIRGVVISNTGKLSACYRVELGFRNVIVGWTISPQGDVTDSFLVHSSGDDTLDACVLETVKGFNYPTSNMPTRVSQYPLKYGLQRDAGADSSP